MEIKTRFIIETGGKPDDVLIETTSLKDIANYMLYNTDDENTSDLCIGKKIIINEIDYIIKDIQIDFRGLERQEGHNCSVWVTVEES